MQCQGKRLSTRRKNKPQQRQQHQHHLGQQQQRPLQNDHSPKPPLTTNLRSFASKRQPIKKGAGGEAQKKARAALYQQQHLQAMEAELNAIKSSDVQLPLEAEVVDDNTPVGDMDDEAIKQQDMEKIFGSKSKMHLPAIPLNGTQCYWALTEDQYNPFSFPVLDLSPILSPTDISVNVETKDSDVSAKELFKDFQSMMNTTIQQGGETPHPDGQASPDENMDQLSKSLKSIANPTGMNPLQAASISQNLQYQHGGSGSEKVQMATSKCQFGETVVFTVPVRKSQVKQIKKVFGIQRIPGEEEDDVTEVDATTGALRQTNDLLNRILTVAKAADTNKRFDVFLTRDPNPQAEQSSLDDLFQQHANPQQQKQNDNDDSKMSTALIFSSNISTQSLDVTRQRLSQQQEEIAASLRAKGKTYDPPILEHACVERNYILDLQAPPSFIQFPPDYPQKLTMHDPITHLLAFPVKGSTITHSTSDPLGAPSTDRAYRVAEAEFLVKSCLMGLNMPAPIDPAFKSLIEQDRAMQLSPEESQQAREVIARSLVAMYGHASGLAAEPWSTTTSIVKPETYIQSGVVNYELEVTYAHNKNYASLYALSLLPSQKQIQKQLEALHSQFKDMEKLTSQEFDMNHLGGIDLAKIRNDIDGVFNSAKIESTNSNNNDDDGDDNVVDAEVVANDAGGDVAGEQPASSGFDFEKELQEKLVLLEEQQFLFQQEMEEKLRTARVARDRQMEAAAQDKTSSKRIR